MEGITIESHRTISIDLSQPLMKEPVGTGTSTIQHPVPIHLQRQQTKENLSDDRSKNPLSTPDLTQTKTFPPAIALIDNLSKSVYLFPKFYSMDSSNQSQTTKYIANFRRTNKSEFRLHPQTTQIHLQNPDIGPGDDTTNEQDQLSTYTTWLHTGQLQQVSNGISPSLLPFIRQLEQLAVRRHIAKIRKELRLLPLRTIITPKDKQEVLKEFARIKEEADTIPKEELDKSDYPGQPSLAELIRKADSLLRHILLVTNPFLIAKQVSGPIHTPTTLNNSFESINERNTTPQFTENFRKLLPNYDDIVNNEQFKSLIDVYLSAEESHFQKQKNLLQEINLSARRPTTTEVNSSAVNKVVSNLVKETQAGNRDNFPLDLTYIQIHRDRLLSPTLLTQAINPIAHPDKQQAPEAEASDEQQNQEDEQDSPDPAKRRKVH